MPFPWGRGLKDRIADVKRESQFGLPRGMVAEMGETFARMSKEPDPIGYCLRSAMNYLIALLCFLEVNGFDLKPCLEEAAGSLTKMNETVVSSPAATLLAVAILTKLEQEWHEVLHEPRH